jgi:hypothetical protein
MMADNKKINDFLISTCFFCVKMVLDFGDQFGCCELLWFDWRL